MTIALSIPNGDQHGTFAQRVYTPIEDALAALAQRRTTHPLQQLERELGIEAPPILRDQEQPVAVLFRQIASPNYEMRRVVRLAREHGMKLVVWEFPADRFLTRNRSKYSLGRLGFYSGLGRRGGRKIEYINVIDLDKENGLPLEDIYTLHGPSFVDFHRTLFFAEFPDFPREQLFDAGPWFRRNGGVARNYYNAFLSLFLSHAILFETFILEGAELEFTNEIVLPVLDRLTERFGLKPLIVPTEPDEWHGDDFWELYPQHLRAHVAPYNAHAQVARRSDLQWLTPIERDETALDVPSHILANAVQIVPHHDRKPQNILSQRHGAGVADPFIAQLKAGASRTSEVA